MKVEDKIYVAINHKPKCVSYSQLSKFDQKEHKRVQFGLRCYLEKKEKENFLEYVEEHKNGYCPHCGMLLPLNGKCSCGYEMTYDVTRCHYDRLKS